VGPRSVEGGKRAQRDDGRVGWYLDNEILGGVDYIDKMLIYVR
jgi:hypothetical protein